MRPLCLLLILLAGCQRPAVTLPARVANKPKSPPGWEVRYNAVLGLLRRGSLNITGADVWDTVTEMLDEDQQLQNFRTTTDDGREVLDETGARSTVIGAMQGLQELHRKRPKIDLLSAKEPLEKLVRSPNATVSLQARQTLLVIFQ
jgi:hypothetical protein